MPLQKWLTTSPSTMQTSLCKWNIFNNTLWSFYFSLFSSKDKDSCHSVLQTPVVHTCKHTRLTGFKPEAHLLYLQIQHLYQWPQTKPLYNNCYTRVSWARWCVTASLPRRKPPERIKIQTEFDRYWIAPTHFSALVSVTAINDSSRSSDGLHSTMIGLHILWLPHRGESITSKLHEE